MEKMRRAKAQQELNLATAVNGNKNVSVNTLAATRRVKEIFHPLLKTVKRLKILMPSFLSL